ncbi:MAG: pyruvate, phosphate dikinase, partial [Myxococcales bacterium]|nr:pyruvate, phosphate dikinase [Myxococcales bacterium]
DGFRRMAVRANADAPADAALARRFGAKGIGLCRTEHMFFAPERVKAMREMLLAHDETARRAALKTLQPMQRADFGAMLRTLAGRPFTVRLLDPPLHEFLPHDEDELPAIAADLGTTVERVRATRAALVEQNPMLGLRGCRLGVTHPEIYAMQVRALMHAACDVMADGIAAQPEVMIPFIITADELAMCRALVEAAAEEVFALRGQRIAFAVGTMIELPRAALTADAIARHADFFSFGTNDLTQTTMGLSRDDAGRFLPTYVERGLLPADPFAQLDTTGVGQLVALGTRLGRQTKPTLHVGICGEHGGEPSSIAFCAQIGLDYVSCSPFRLPIARLALAHAGLASQSRSG